MPADFLPERHLEGLWALPFELQHMSILKCLLYLLSWLFTDQLIPILLTYSNIIFKQKIYSNWIILYHFFPTDVNYLFSSLPLDIVFLTEKIFKSGLNINEHHK